MTGLHLVLGAPRRRTLEGAALASVALLTAAATPPVVAAIPAAAEEVAGNPLAMLAVAMVTASLAAALARWALRARSPFQTRVWLAFGGAGAGVLATLLSYAAAATVNGAPLVRNWPLLLAGSLAGGGPIGFVFGTAFAPAVLATRRAIEQPSHDGLDRILFAGGAALAGLGVVRALIPVALPGASLGWTALLAGAGAALFALVRLVARVRLLARVRDGGEPGFHVVPLSGREDEEPLVPLVRTSVPPAGVIAATGASAPYRGARGIFKLALAPLPEQRVAHPFADLLRAVVHEGAGAVLTLVVGASALLVVTPVLVLVVVATW